MTDARPGPLRRKLALAWSYRAECLRVLLGQLASLALGLGALAGSGLAVDVVRRAVDPGGRRSAGRSVWPRPPPGRPGGCWSRSWRSRCCWRRCARAWSTAPRWRPAA